MNAITSRNYLQDGYLVVGAITQRGCVSYSHKNREEQTDGKRLDADWQTHKVCLSVEEDKKLGFTRGILTRKIEQLGTSLSGYGVYIPVTKARELEETIREVYQGIEDYNSESEYTRLEGSFVVFPIKGGDERVAQVLYNRTVDLLGAVNSAIEKGDVKGLRDALGKMKGLDRVLPVNTGEKLTKMIETARKAARRAVKAVKKSTDIESKQAEKIANELSGLNVEGIRASFVEIADEVNSKAANRTIVPDIVEVRQIEEMDSEA